MMMLVIVEDNHQLSDSVSDPAESYTYTFNGADSYGDGWNGWTVDILVDGVAVGRDCFSEWFSWIYYIQCGQFSNHIELDWDLMEVRFHG